MVASEVMAIFCLATSLKDLKDRLGKIVVGYTRDSKPILARDINAHGAMTALLRDALAPNLVQTLENNPAFIHGGPFANIAHGCNSVMATQAALKLADYVVTEAGFGADLGAEKFVDIKCRKAGLTPSCAVIVATIRALKYHGGVEVADVGKENLAALEKGLVNLERHIHNVRNQYGLESVVAINHRTEDTDAEIQPAAGAALAPRREDHRREALCRRRQGRARGGEGSRAPVRAAQQLPLRVRIRAVAVGQDEDHRARRSTARSTSSPTARSAGRSRRCRKRVTDTTRCASPRRSTRSPPIPSCAARPSGHVVNVREVRLAAGAEFIVMICGDIMTMPGLPQGSRGEQHRRGRERQDRRAVLRGKYFSGLT